MRNLKNKKKNNVIVTAATLFTLATIVFATTTTTTIMAPSAQGSRSEDGFIDPTSNLRNEPKAPNGSISRW
jgi:hypothetical protein